MMYTISAVVPGAPTLISASNRAYRSSVIQFSAPSSNGGASITQYTIYANSLTRTSTTAGTITFTGLADNTAYTVYVTATNAVGTSSASTRTSITTGTSCLQSFIV